MRRRFEQHLAPEVVSRLVAQPELLRLEGEMREITAVFTDIEGFTAMTERVDPRTLVALLDRYFDGLTRIVIDHGGMVEKIVGDGLHAIFNAPIDLADHPRRAVDCAMAIRDFGERFRNDSAGRGRRLRPHAHRARDRHRRRRRCRRRTQARLHGPWRGDEHGGPLRVGQQGARIQHLHRPGDGGEAPQSSPAPPRPPRRARSKHACGGVRSLARGFGQVGPQDLSQGGRLWPRGIRWPQPSSSISSRA